MGSKGSKNHNHDHQRHGEHIIPEERPYTTSATQAGIISGATAIPGLSSQIPVSQISTHVPETTTNMPGTIISAPGHISSMPNIIPGATIQTESLPYTTMSGQEINTNTFR
jgi:hypothetical protein